MKIIMNNKKSLILYFSREDENYSVGYIDKGNTEVIADFIKDITGADTFKVERKKAYPKEYMPCTKEAQEEQNIDARPELIKELDNIDNYDVIYIGSPVWWGVMPQPMVTQLEKLDFSGKTVRVFTTHEGSGLGSIPSQVKRLCVGANVLDNSLAIKGSSVNSAKSIVEDWI